MQIDEVGHDTELARALHQAGRLNVQALQRLLAHTRAAQGASSTTLARTLVIRGLLSEQEATAFLGRIPTATRPAYASTSGPGGSVAWRPGSLVGEFRLLERLGSGSNGAVFLVEHATQGGRYALKTLLATDDEEARQRFEREAEAQLRAGFHPNVVRVLGRGLQDGRPFLVMEHVAGGDLAVRLRGGRLPIPEAVTMARDLAHGLVHMHKIGVLHRDIKPANVLLDEDGTPKLVDFGLARFDGAESMTRTGDLVGTPAFMAPEQALGHKHLLGPCTDVYALGTILYTLLSGAAPFSGATVIDMLTQVVEDLPTPLRILRPEVTPALEALCQRAMAKDGVERPDAAEFAVALDQVLAGESRSGGASRRMRPLLFVAAIGLALAVVAAVAGILGLQRVSGSDAGDGEGVASIPSGGPLEHEPEASTLETTDVSAAAPRQPEVLRWEIGPEEELRYALRVETSLGVGDHLLLTKRRFVFTWRLGSKEDVWLDEDDEEDEEEEEEDDDDWGEEDGDDGTLIVVAKLVELQVKVKAGPRAGLSPSEGRMTLESRALGVTDLSYDSASPQGDPASLQDDSPFAAAMGSSFSFKLDPSTGRVLEVYNVNNIQAKIFAKLPPGPSPGMSMVLSGRPDFRRMRHTIPELSAEGMREALNGFMFTLPDGDLASESSWSRTRPFPLRALGFPMLMSMGFSMPPLEVTAEVKRNRRGTRFDWAGRIQLADRDRLKGTRRHSGDALFQAGKLQAARIDESFSGEFTPRLGRHRRGWSKPGGDSDLRPPAVEPKTIRGWVKGELRLLRQ